jgi:hypothetical protein
MSRVPPKDISFADLFQFFAQKTPNTSPPISTRINYNNLYAEVIKKDRMKKLQSISTTTYISEILPIQTFAASTTNSSTTSEATNTIASTTIVDSISTERTNIEVITTTASSSVLSTTLTKRLPTISSLNKELVSINTTLNKR